MNICIECVHSERMLGAGNGDTTDRARCSRKKDANGEPVACESERFAEADEERGVCGAQGIFWVARK